MEKQIKEVFDGITMPPESAARIQNALRQPSRPGRNFQRFLRPLMAIAALALSLGLVFGSARVAMALDEVSQDLSALNQEKEAVTKALDDVSRDLSDMNQEKEETAQALEALREEVLALKQFKNRVYSFQGGNVTVGIVEGGGTFVYNYGTIPTWLKVQAGRLMFVMNGAKCDITDLISEETPFTFIVKDSDGITHYIAVGGTFYADNFPQGLGWMEYYRELEAEGTGELEGWIGGYGANQAGHNHDGDPCPWETRAKEILGIPWALQ